MLSDCNIIYEQALIDSLKNINERDTLFLLVVGFTKILLFSVNYIFNLISMSLWIKFAEAFLPYLSGSKFLQSLSPYLSLSQYLLLFLLTFLFIIFSLLDLYASNNMLKLLSHNHGKDKSFLYSCLTLFQDLLVSQ